MQALARMRRLGYVGVVVMGILAATVVSAQPTTGQWTVLTAPDNSFNIWVLQGDQSVMSIATGGWGPKWTWKPNLSSKAKASGGLLQMTAQFAVDKKTSQIINVAGVRVLDQDGAFTIDTGRDHALY